VTARQRVVVGGLLLGALLAGVALVAFASLACPVETVSQPCPEASRNVVAVVVLASTTAALLVTPFAFLAEFGVRRIVYRGAWWRAGRRGAIVGLTVAALAGLRLGGALTVPAAIFLAILAVVVERFLAMLDADRVPPHAARTDADR
jgi:hypothetical protein